MILRTSNRLARVLVLVAAVLFGSWLSFFSIRAAVARYVADGDRLRLAVRLEPGNPEYWYLLGRYQQYNLEQPDSVLAEASYKKAIELNPFYTDAWLELATAYELDGNFDEARSAYVQAQKSHPVSTEVFWRYGSFLLRQGNQVLAYTEMRRAIEADPALAAIAFSRAYRSNPNIDEILQQLLPAEPRVYAEVLKEAISEKQLAVARTVWNELIALHPQLAIEDVNRLVGALLQTHDYAAAQRVWNQGVATMDLPPLLEVPGSVIWDSSFESGVSGVSFSWRYAPINQGVIISLDRSEKRTGLQSLRLSFDGKHNPDLNAGCISGIVQPRTTYHFAGWIKTNDITTENGIEFQVYSPDNRNVPVFKTHEFHATIPWTLVEGTWTTSTDTHQVEVCVKREPSDNPQTRISGTAWVDDITLIPQATERRKP